MSRVAVMTGSSSGMTGKERSHVNDL